MVPRLGLPFHGTLTVWAHGPGPSQWNLFSAEATVGPLAWREEFRRRQEREVQQLIQDNRQVNADMLQMFRDSSEVILATSAAAREARLMRASAPQDDSEGESTGEALLRAVGPMGELAGGLVRQWQESRAGERTRSPGWAAPQTGQAPGPPDTVYAWGREWPRAPSNTGLSSPTAGDWKAQGDGEATVGNASEPVTERGSDDEGSPGQSAAVRPGAPGSGGSTIASVPFMITAEMRAKLIRMGMTLEDVDRLTPIDAWEVLRREG
jgi:hypothetical protein